MCKYVCTYVVGVYACCVQSFLYKGTVICFSFWSYLWSWFLGFGKLTTMDSLFIYKANIHLLISKQAMQLTLNLHDDTTDWGFVFCLVLQTELAFSQQVTRKKKKKWLPSTLVISVRLVRE